jgi:hypothetical protein
MKTPLKLEMVRPCCRTIPTRFMMIVLKMCFSCVVSQFMFLGFLSCLDAFLHNFTYLPLRGVRSIILAPIRLLRYAV